MMIFKKSIPRRRFLRGLGASVALPFLDSMVPAFGASEIPVAKRFSIFYVPNGIIMNQWTPKSEGAAFEPTPILEPLALFQDRLMVLSGLAQNQGHSMPGEIAGDHPRACAAYLTCTHPKMTSGPDMRAGTSVDQIAARELGQRTQLTSLEVGLESAEILGSCESAYSCAYYNTICWRTPTTPLPMENNPRVVFERLFGNSDTTNAAERRARIQEDRSILDFIMGDASRLMKELGPTDQTKVSQYLDAVRDIERRIESAERQAPQQLPTAERPIGIPETFTEHIKLLIDLQVLAFQSDMTRVSTLMVGHEMGVQSYPELGFSDPYHPLTHHQGDLEKIAKVIKIDIYHTQILAYYLEKLRSIREGDGSLLDRSMILYGSGLSDGNLHLHDNLPVLLVNGGAGQVKGGRHIRYPQGTPMANLYLTILERLGVSQESLGDSTGKLSLSV